MRRLGRRYDRGDGGEDVSYQVGREYGSHLFHRLASRPEDHLVSRFVPGGCDCSVKVEWDEDACADELVECTEEPGILQDEFRLRIATHEGHDDVADEDERCEFEQEEPGGEGFARDCEKVDQDAEERV